MKLMQAKKKLNIGITLSVLSTLQLIQSGLPLPAQANVAHSNTSVRSNANARPGAGGPRTLTAAPKAAMSNGSPSPSNHIFDSGARSGNLHHLSLLGTNSKLAGNTQAFGSLISDDQQQVKTDQAKINKDEDKLKDDPAVNKAKEEKQIKSLKQQVLNNEIDIQGAVALEHVLKDNWAQWTGNGTMTIAKLNKLANDANLPANQAAAVAALIMQLDTLISYHQNWEDPRIKLGSDGQVLLSVNVPAKNGKPTPPERTMNLFNAPDSNDEYSGSRLFVNAEHHLAKDVNANGSYKLYGPGGPNPNDIRQWQDGDCYFLSYVFGRLKQDGPKAIKELIKPVHGKKDEYRVYYGAYSKPVTITLTPVDVALASYNTDGGVYIAVLQKAADNYFRKADPDGLNNQLSMGNIINGDGGWPSQTVHLVQGAKTHAITISGTGSGLTHSQIDSINNSLAAGNPVEIHTAGHVTSVIGITNQAPTQPAGIHVYGSSGPYVIIHNQWGNTGNYTTAPDFAVQMVNGYFAMSVSDLSKYGFEKICVTNKGQKPIVPQTQSTAAQTKSENGALATGSSPATSIALDPQIADDYYQALSNE